MCCTDPFINDGEKKVLLLRAAIEGSISLGVYEKRETRKSRSEEKVVGFNSAFLFPVRKWEAVTQGENHRDSHPTWMITQGVGIIKGWEDKRERVRIPETFTENKNITSAGPAFRSYTNQRIPPDDTCLPLDTDC